MLSVIDGYGGSEGHDGDGFVPLAEIAKRSGCEANVLRKHHVAGWEKRGAAKKLGERYSGVWMVDPAVLAELRPTKHRVKREPVMAEVGGGKGTGTREQGTVGKKKSCGEEFVTPSHVVSEIERQMLLGGGYEEPVAAEKTVGEYTDPAAQLYEEAVEEALEAIGALADALKRVVQALRKPCKP